MSMTSVGLKAQIKAWIHGTIGKEADPTHEVHRIGVRVLAGDRDLARKPQDKESSPAAGRADNEKRCKRQIIPEIEVG